MITRRKLMSLAAATAALDSSAAPKVRTTVAIDRDQFRINGKPTYEGRSYKGMKIEGLLLNSRMVQGIFDDLNPVQIVIKILTDIVPTNIFKAMAEDHILQVVVFAIFLGVIINALGDKVRMIREFVQQAAYVVFKMIETIIKFSPYGVFALMAQVVAQTSHNDILKLPVTK